MEPNPREQAQQHIKAMMERINGIYKEPALGALLILYQDAIQSRNRTYGPMDASSAYQAIYRFMQAMEELARVESILDDVRWALRAMSDDLYREK